MPNSFYGEPRTSLVKWLAHIDRDLSPELRSRLLASPFSTPLPLLLGVTNSFAVAMVAYYRSGYPILLAIGCLDLLLAGVRVALMRRRGKPADPLFVTGLLWAMLQAMTIWVVVTAGDVVVMIVVLASSLAVIGGIVARNFATPRYAFAQVLLIDLTFKVAFLTVNPTFLPLIAAQSMLFIVYNFAIMKQHRETALRAMKAEIESREQSFTDPLTQLLNRRGLEAEAKRMVARHPSMVLFYIDLDGFKGVNDRSGHATGDLVLQEVANRLRATVPDGTAISRLGGDEFLLLAAMGSDDEIRSWGARIVIALSIPYATETASMALIGASVGAARWTESGGSLESCMAAADGALYRAKAGGRGRCILAEPAAAETTDAVIAA